MKKKNSLQDLMTLNTLNHILFMLFITVCQVYSLVCVMISAANFPASPDELLLDKITSKYWCLWDITQCYKNTMFCDTISLVGILANLLTMLRGYRWIGFFLESVTESLKVALAFMAIFVFNLFGMAICSMTLYGNESLRYSNFANSLLYLFFS